MKFSYTASTQSGEIIKGETDGADQATITEELATKGLQLVSLKETGTVDRGMSRLNDLFSRVKISELIIFSRSLSALIKAGLSLPRALLILKRQTKNIKFQHIIDDLVTQISKGKNFSTALAIFPKTFSPLFVSMAHAGEESGKLADAMSLISQQLDRQYILKRKIKGAMMYPAIILIAMIVIGILMLIYVVPTLTSTFKELGVELPILTQIIIGVSDFLIENTFLFLALVAFGIFSISSAMKSKRLKPYFDLTLLYIPLISPIYRQVQSARTVRTLSSLLSSGVAISDSIEITKNVMQNTHYKTILDNAGENIHKGEPISDAFAGHERMYPVLVPEMMAVGEETGKLSDMLNQVADFYENEVETATKDLSTIVEPILMVFIGTGVGFFAMAMIQPMYSLVDKV
jgi:type IV pilus assembly protein PilC